MIIRSRILLVGCLCLFPAAQVVAQDAAAPVTVEMKTSLGAIEIELDAAKAPKTVKNFLNYVEKKHYDNTIFHRVIDGFMIQGGGFAKSKDGIAEKKTGDGVRNEAKNGLKNKRGTIAMARRRDPHSATAQFFINVNDNDNLDFPSFDGWGYAVFGRVTKGMDVVDKIKGVQTVRRKLKARTDEDQLIEAEMKDVPAEDVVIVSVRVKQPAAP